jgi:hypothetical protein
VLTPGNDSLENGYNAAMRRARPISFLLHASVAMVISPIVAWVGVLGAVIIFNHSHGMNSVLNAGGAANPLLWWPGLILGLLVNRFALKSIACWVWLAGMVWIACGVFASLYTYHARFAGICSPLDSIRNGFFSHGFYGSTYCGDHANLMLFTVPTFNSIAYSLGAWVALRFSGSATSLPR